MKVLHSARQLLISLILALPCHADITAGLSIWYPFEGNVTDASGRGQHGIANGSVTYETGKHGLAVSIDSADDWIDIPEDIFRDQMTAAAWVMLKPGVVAHELAIANGWRPVENFGLGLKNVGGQTVFAAGFHDRESVTQIWPELHANGTTLPSPDIWYHVALTYDRVNLKLYVNGALEATTARFGGTYSVPPQANPDLRAGEGAWFRGLLEDFRIYDRALSATDIAELTQASTIAGTITGAGADKQVRISAVTGSSSYTATRTGNGPYNLPPLGNGRTYTVSAYEDTNGDGALSYGEPLGEYPAPLVLDSNKTGIDIQILPADTDSDGLPDAWERRYGLAVGTNDSQTDNDGDGLTNLGEFTAGSNPAIPDSDADGLPDSMEWLQHGTSTTIADSDGDGMADGWEITNGLNPLLNDAADDRDLDGLTNKEEFDRRADGYSANTAFSFPNPPDGIPLSDYRRLKGEGWVRRAYDKNDRLIATERDSGMLQAYVYDGNSQKKRDLLASSLDADGDGLPDAWEFVHALAFAGAGAGTGRNGTAGDPDADGFTNAQEWKAGTDPMSGTSRPSLGASLAGGAMTAPTGFIPTNWVMATGQLDGFGADELVVSADGAIGPAVNSLSLYTRSQNGWAIESISVGSNGVTSIVLGEPAPGFGPGIYAGMRAATGAGSIQEQSRAGGTWIKSAASVAESTGTGTVQVINLTQTHGLIAAMSPAGSPANALFRQQFSDGKWAAPAVLETAVGAQSLAAPAGPLSVRWRDDGTTELAGPIPTERPDASLNPIVRTESGSWYFTTPAIGWAAAEEMAVQNKGHLATIEDAAENAWFANNLAGGNYWFGVLPEPQSAPNPMPRWVSGSSTQFRNWGDPGQAYFGATIVTVMSVVPKVSALWYRRFEWQFPASNGLGELSPTVNSTQIVVPPPMTSRLVWRGRSLGAGALRSKSSISCVSAVIDDKTLPIGVNTGDEFVLSEYEMAGATQTLRTAIRLPITSASKSGAYGLTILRRADATKPGTLAVGEPDGIVSLWTAPDATAPLMRKVFTTEFAGKAWHQMEPLREADGREGLVGLLVDPAAPNQCQVIH